MKIGTIIALLVACLVISGCQDEEAKPPEETVSEPVVKAVSPWKSSHATRVRDEASDKAAERFFIQICKDIPSWPKDDAGRAPKWAEVARNAWEHHLSKPEFLEKVSEKWSFRMAGRVAEASDSEELKGLVRIRLAEHYFPAGAGCEALWRLNRQEVATLTELLVVLGGDGSMRVPIVVDWVQHNGRWIPDTAKDKWRSAYARDAALGRIVGPKEAMRRLDALVNAEGLVSPGVARKFTWACREQPAWRRYLDKKIAHGSETGDRLAGWLLARAYVEEVHRRPPIALRGRRWVEQALGAAETEWMRMVCTEWLATGFLIHEQFDEGIALLGAIPQFTSEDNRQRLGVILASLEASKQRGIRRDTYIAKAAELRRLRGYEAAGRADLDRAIAASKSAETLTLCRQSLQELQAKIGEAEAELKSMRTASASS